MAGHRGVEVRWDEFVQAPLPGAFPGARQAAADRAVRVDRAERGIAGPAEAARLPGAALLYQRELFLQDSLLRVAAPTALRQVAEALPQA